VGELAVAAVVGCAWVTQPFFIKPSMVG
jgi:hypothetical protein